MTDPNMKKVAFQTQDVVQGDDGELYHLPTLRALYSSGRLPSTAPPTAWSRAWNPSSAASPPEPGFQLPSQTVDAPYPPGQLR